MNEKSLISSRSGHEAVVKQEDRVHSSIGKEEGVAEIAQIGVEGNVFDENKSILHSSPNRKDTGGAQADQLVSTKLEMNEVKEENDRLKKLLDHIMKDYQSLQMHLFDIVQHEQGAKKSTNTTPTDEVAEESELVSLRLGRSPSSEQKSTEEIKNNNSTKSKREEDLQEGLALGLGCKFGLTKSLQMEHGLNPSPENSTDETKKADSDEQLQQSKILKTVRSQEDEPLHQPQVKKTRVSVRARCNAPTMNDGCQWRKYGQKTAKGNPCPRAYYRCTIALACPVRKQVQRSVEDMSILITTYEGTHNHPLPISASAMASTTSAAASMLTSGSSTSLSPLGTTNTATTFDIQRLLNFTLPHNNARPSHYTLTNSSFISSSPSHPTITLDLTAPSSSSSSSLYFPTPPKFSPPTPSFNFSTMESNSVPTSWSNNVHSANYGSQPYNKSPIGSSYLAKQAQLQYTPYMQNNNYAINHDSIEAASKAITSDPSFHAALAAAISSIVGNGGAMGACGDQAGRHNDIQNSKKWAEPLLALNKSPSSSSPPRETLGFLQPSLPFSSTAFVVESRDKMNQRGSKFDDL